MVNEAQHNIDPERIVALGGADLANPYARFTLALGASAQDFSFGKSIFDVMDGNPDGESVSGVAGISLIDDETGKRRGRDKDKDEGGLSWDDVRDANERMRAEIANISLSNGQFHIFGMEIDEADMDAAVKDTIKNFDAFASKHNLQGEGKDQFQQLLLYYNSLPEGDPRKAEALRDMATIDLDAAQDIAWEAKNQEQSASPDRFENAADSAALQAQGDAEVVVARSTAGGAVENNAVIANIDDTNVQIDALEANGYNAEEVSELASTSLAGGSDSMAFLGGEREGPVISSTYNSSATGTQQIAQAPAPAEPGQRSNVEFGIG